MPLRRASTLVPGPKAAPGPGSAATSAVVTGFPHAEQQTCGVNSGSAGPTPRIRWS